MKNKEIIPLLQGIQKLDKLKLGGIELKTILKNKKALMVAYEELEEVRKKLRKQYAEDDSVKEGDETFTPENEKLITKEWIYVNEADSGVIISKLNSAKLDQLSDLTLEQMEALEMMSE